jgi:hypothetical protein
MYCVSKKFGNKTFKPEFWVPGPDSQNYLPKRKSEKKKEISGISWSLNVLSTYLVRV